MVSPLFVGEELYLGAAHSSLFTALVESDESRFTFEFPHVVNPYVVVIGEYPTFYRFPNETDGMKTARFAGLVLGTGVLKRTEAIDFRLGAEWVSGVLSEDAYRLSGQKTIEFIQAERDRTRKTKYDEPLEGGRVFVSL